MGEIRFVGTGETRGYPYPVCKKEKSQPEGKRIMPETRFTEFPAVSVDPRVNISRSKPRFRHYPLILGLGFLGLHRR